MKNTTRMQSSNIEEMNMNWDKCISRPRLNSGNNIIWKSSV